MDKKLIAFYILVIISIIYSFLIFYCARVLKIDNILTKPFLKCTKCNKKRQNVIEMCCSNYNNTYFYIIIHFTIYFILGLIFPGYVDRIILISIIYELIEASTDYTTGCWQDIIINTLGYILGSYLIKFKL